MPPDQPPYTPTEPVVSEVPEPGWKTALGVARAVFSWAVLPIAIVLLLHTFVFQAFRVVGHSMVPTLQEGDYLIISKLAATLERSRLGGDRSGHYLPDRGDVVIFKYPQNPELIFVKRVIGIPGDRVVIKGGQVRVYNANRPRGFNPDQTYDLGEVFTTGEADEVVPQGRVFVVGDNRSPNGSFDSREWGFLPSEYLIGKVVMRLLPLDQLRFFSALTQIH